MNTLGMALSSPGSSSGYGSAAEEDHSLLFPFPCFPPAASDSSPASPSSDSGFGSFSFASSSPSSLHFKEVLLPDALGSVFGELEFENDLPDLDLTSDLTLTDCGQFGDNLSAQLTDRVCEIDSLGEMWKLLDWDRNLTKKDLPSSSATLLPPGVVEEKDGERDETDASLLIFLLREMKRSSHFDAPLNNCDITSAINTSAAFRGPFPGFPKTVEEVPGSLREPFRSSGITNEENEQYPGSVNSSLVLAEEHSPCTLGFTTHKTSSSSSSSLSSSPALASDHHFTSDLGNQSKTTICVSWTAENQRTSSRCHDTSPTPDKGTSTGRRRSRSELEDHPYSSVASETGQLPPSKLAKTRIDGSGTRYTGNGSHRPEKSILETFLLTKETLHANKGSDAMLAEGNIARLHCGSSRGSHPVLRKDLLDKPASCSSTSVLERLLTERGGGSTDERDRKSDAFREIRKSQYSLETGGSMDDKTCKSDAFREIRKSQYSLETGGSMDDKTRKSDACWENRKSEESLEIDDDIFFVSAESCSSMATTRNAFDDSFTQATNTLQFEFLCDDLDDQIWTPSCVNNEVFSNEMDALINGQSLNKSDVWMHQYLSDLL